MADVEELTFLNRVLLYNSYNKDKFDKFTSYTENLIILENFLRRTNFYISQALGTDQPESTKELGKEPLKVDGKDLIESLKQQVKKRERKILFPEDASIGVPAKTAKKRVTKAEAKAAKDAEESLGKQGKTVELKDANTGEQASINSFKSFAYHMQVVIQTKLLAKLEKLYS